MGTTHPFIVGVAGLSSSGKSTMTSSFDNFTPKDTLAHLDMDGYHLRSRSERRILDEFPDQLNANNFEKLIQDIDTFYAGNEILVPSYDHRQGTFTRPKLIQPKPILIIEGLHAGLLNQIAQKKIVDFSIFLYPDETLRRKWKIQRDLNQRNYSLDEVMKQLKNRRIHEQNLLMTQVQLTNALVRIREHKSHVLLGSSGQELLKETANCISFGKLTKVHGRAFRHISTSILDCTAVIHRALEKNLITKRFQNIALVEDYQQTASTLWIMVLNAFFYRGSRWTTQSLL